jgi:Skp family chaperone for outer membrane proteins
MNTKVFLFITCFFMLSLQTANAQRGIRIGYVDMDYILENVPEYQEASKQLEDKANRWKGEIEGKLGEVDAMKKQLNNERPLLTPELIEERNEEIKFEEEQILDYRQKRFGPGGDLAIQRRQLVEPVQDQVINAVQEISTNKKYDYVINKSDVIMLYSADRHDISDQVLRSITRSAKRKQINNRKEEDDFDRDESKTVEQDQATLERQKQIEEKKNAREAALEERAATRETQKAERQKAFEERRKRLLEERQKKKDSLDAIRASKAEARTPSKTAEGEEKADPADARKAALEARKKRKDSIITARKKRRDSILKAREERLNPPVPDNDDDGGK